MLIICFNNRVIDVIGDWLLVLELKHLVAMHSEEQEGFLSTDETTIIKGALDLKEKNAMMVMTPLDKVFMMEASMHLTKDTLEQVSPVN